MRETKREIEREGEVYIYLYIERGRERKRERHEIFLLRCHNSLFYATAIISFSISIRLGHDLV